LIIVCRALSWGQKGGGSSIEEMMDVMIVSGEHLARLVNDVLDFSKIEAGAWNHFIDLTHQP
jgi:signal transduction histidine kinase